MSTDTSSALDQPTATAATPKNPRDKVMRIATMTRQLLDEVHTQTLDAASRDRLGTIDTHIIDELLTDLAPDLREELQRLALPLTGHTELSDSELRLAHAQLVGWLQGLLQTTQTALPDPHTVAANDSTTVPTAHNHHDRPHDEPCRPTKPLPEDRAPTEENLGIRVSTPNTDHRHHQTHHTTTPHRSSSSRRTPSHRSEGDPTTPSQHRRIHPR
jgi:hypothetical protein